MKLKKNRSSQNESSNLEVVALAEWGEQYSIQTQNYKGLSFNNGELIQKAETIEEFLEIGKKGKPCLIQLDEVNEIFYNFYAISDSRGFAPEGFRVPSEKDWSWIFHCLNVKTPEEAEVDLNDSLEENYVCDNDDRDYIEDTVEIYETENFKNNFNAKPSGYIDQWDKELLANEKHAMYWTSKDRSGFDAPDDAFWVGLNSSYIWLGAYDNIRQTFKSKYEGMAVRLLKDEFLVSK